MSAVVSGEPCHTCSAPVAIVPITIRRAGGTAPGEGRTCTNPDCRTNGPRSRRRLGDKV